MSQAGTEHSVRGGPQDPQGLFSGLKRIREVARRDKRVRFSALLHHVTVELLEASYRKLNPKATPGVDGITWHAYGERLDEKLRDLHERIHRGRYRAKPARRSYIPKEGGEQRPLGIAALEDKIVQQATVWILEQVYEEAFQGFSYGFRPGRHPHKALDALYMAVKVKKINWILDADIRKFFDREGDGVRPLIMKNENRHAIAIHYNRPDPVTL